MKRLKGKVVLITGSSVGIGRETAYLFAEEGAKLIITYCKNKEAAGKAALKCRELGSPEVLVLKIDLADTKSIELAVEKAVGSFGLIDILINNAGVIAWKHLREQSYFEIDNQIEINLSGLIKMTKISLPFIKETIINVSSRSGQKGHEKLTTYCATKFGVRGFTKALACEIGLKVFSVNPPLTKTGMSGYQGIPANDVAGVILDAAKRREELESGSDISVLKPEERK